MPHLIIIGAELGKRFKSPHALPLPFEWDAVSDTLYPPAEPKDDSYHMANIIFAKRR